MAGLGLILGALSGGANSARESLAQSEQFRQQQEIESQRNKMRVEAERAAAEYKNKLENSPKESFNKYLTASEQAASTEGKPLDSVATIRNAMSNALKSNDAPAFEYGKKLLGDAVVNVGPDSSMYNVVAGSTEFQNSRGEERARIAASEAVAKRAGDQEFRREQAEKDRSLKRELEGSRAASARDLAAIVAESRKDSAVEKVANKPLPKPIVNEIKDARDNATTMNRLKDQFKPDFASKGILGMGSEAELSAKAVIGADKDSVEWWKNYRKNAELVERHAMFGASLTQGEKSAWASADISPGMDAGVIKRNLDFREKLSRKVLDNTRQDYIDAGYSQTKVNLIAGRDNSDIGGRTQTSQSPAKNTIPSGWSVTEKP